MPLALEVCVNDRACWRNVPLPFWRYEMGGCQVLKKWLSCWDWGLLGQVLLFEVVASFLKAGHRTRETLVVEAGGMSK